MRLPGWIERLLLLTGIILLGALFYALDPREVLESLRQVGAGIFLIVLQQAFAIIANSAAWWATFPPGPQRVPFRSVIAARLAGDAVNSLTPTATIGGEFIRVRMLLPYLNAHDGAASVAVSRLSETVGLIGFLAIGLWFVLPEVPLAANVRQGFKVGFLIFASLVAIAVVVQRWGMFTAGSRMARRLGVPLPARLDAAITRLDQQIARAYRGSAWPFLLSAAAFGVGWYGGVLEVYLGLWLLNLPVSLQTAIAIEVISVTVDTLAFFVPLGLGIQEGGKVLAFSLLGLAPAKGFALAILCRIRQVSWAMVGLAILARRHIRRDQILEPVEEPRG